MPFELDQSDPFRRALAQNAAFPTTQWSQVLRVGSDETCADSAGALEKLCERYWPPIYAFVRRDGQGPEEACDIVQSFFAHLLRRDDLRAVSPGKGRFRSFLLTALKHYLVSSIRAERAKKRQGAWFHVSLASEDAESVCGASLADPASPDKAFDRQWARTVLASALQRLRAEHRSPRQEQLFRALEPSLVDDGRVHQQAALADELGITPGALAVAATRLRKRFRALVEAEVVETLDHPDYLEAEMRALREAWL